MAGPSGRGQRSGSSRGRNRMPNLTRFYHARIGDARGGDWEFRLLCLRPSRPRRVDLTAAVESLEWADDAAFLTGSVALRRRGPGAAKSVPVGRGHRVRLDVKVGQLWRTLWEMRVPGYPSVDRVTGAISITAEDDLAALGRNERKWSFRKTGSRPNGWKAHEIAAHVGRKEGVPLDRLARGREWIEKLEHEGTGLEVIKKAYAKEKEETGVRYIIRFRRGRLQVVPFERPHVLYVVGRNAESLTFDAAAKSERPATLIKATGQIDGEKAEVEVTDDRLRRRYGRVVREKDYGKVDSREQLRNRARRDLTRDLEAKRTASITVPGVPFLERGSALRLNVNEPGWRGRARFSRDRRYCYVRTVYHSVSPGRYTCDVEAVQVDPYLRDRRRLERERREERRRKREKQEEEQEA